MTNQQLEGAMSTHGINFAPLHPSIPPMTSEGANSAPQETRTDANWAVTGGLLNDYASANPGQPSDIGSPTGDAGGMSSGSGQ